MRIELDLLVSSFDTADRKTMKSLHTNPECQQLNVTPVLSALNYIFFSMLYLCSALSASSVRIYTKSYIKGIFK